MVQRTKIDEPDARVVADYAATMCADLAVMARRQGFDTLGYLLDMARLEAENLNRRLDGVP
jgi:hypothetical protein